MNTVAQQALLKLLDQAESAWGRASADRKITLRFSEASLLAYLKISSHAERQACHGDLQLAEHNGAISLEWDVRAGVRRQIERVMLVDAGKLAQFLGVVPLWLEVQQAEQALARSTERFPVLRSVIATWSRSTQVRGTCARQHVEWCDAARVVEYCLDSGGMDLPIRRVSTVLFQDSKRVGRLWSMMDVLLQGEVGAVARAEEEVFGQLGLTKFPPTFLLAGTATVHSSDCRTPLVSPYLGFAPRSIETFSDMNGTRMLLSVENLETFHELAGLVGEAEGCVLIYTGGMPSPSWLRVYRLLLDRLPAGAHVFHFGDIDAGGFRIAEYIAKVAHSHGRSLRLHGMDGSLASRQEGKLVARGELKQREVSAISRSCERWNWLTEGEWVSTHKLAVEQESMRCALPRLDFLSQSAELSVTR